MGVFLVKSNREFGWDWDEDYFSSSRGSWGWGGREWINHNPSFSAIAAIRRGDLLLAYQTADKQIIGYAWAASSGIPCRDGCFCAIDFSSHKRRLNQAVDVGPALRRRIAAFRPGSGTGTVFVLSPKDIAAVKGAIIAANPKLADLVQAEFASHSNGGRQPSEGSSGLRIDPDDDKPAGRRSETIIRSIRDSANARWLRNLYDGKCQVCGAKYLVQGDAIAEGHHVRPLSRKHKGPDNVANMILLCPTHHAIIDRGGLFISLRSKRVYDFDGKRFNRGLALSESHPLAPKHVGYHNRHIFCGKRPTA